MPLTVYATDSFPLALDINANFRWAASEAHPAKLRVTAATTGALPANTASGSTLTGNANGALAAQDGVTLALNDSLLVKNEATGANDGLYTLTQVGDGSHPYILTRRNDADTDAKQHAGMRVYVMQGAVNQDSYWRLQATVDPTTGVTSQVWVFGANSSQVGVDVTGSSDVTLTQAQAGSVSVRLTGVLGASINVIVPLTPRLWYFRNDTTGAFTLTVKGATGSGIAVSQGAGLLLLSDGTNIVTPPEADISGLVADLALKAPLASPALTGTPTAPTAAVDTNTTQLATTAFVLANRRVPVVEVTGTSQVAAVNTRYVANNAGLVTVTLPATAAIGDVVYVLGKGAGGWKLAQNSGQTVHGASDTTTGAGGSLASSARYDTVRVVCVTANTDWVIEDKQGTLVVV